MRADIATPPTTTNARRGGMEQTMERLRIAASLADVTLNTDILDHIDELVSPGVTLNPDNSYGAAELKPEARRR
jgi:hypothetical protein